AVPLDRNHLPLRLRDRDAERDRARKAHAAEHVEILRPPTARPQIEVRVANSPDDGFIVLQLRHEPLRQLEAVHPLGVGNAAHAANTFPPVSMGDRISAHGACVATACLMERSTMNSTSSSRAMVWCSISS